MKSVFRSAAWRTEPPREGSAVGGRAGEGKTDWTKPLPLPPGVWGLNTPGSFAGARSGHAGWQSARQPVRRSIGSARICAFGPGAGTSVTLKATIPSLRSGGRFGFVRSEPRARVMMCIRNRPADLGPSDAVDHHHDAGVAMRTFPQGSSGQCLIAVAIVSGVRIGRRSGRCHPEQFPAVLELPCAMAVAEEAVVPDAVKPTRMDQEAADELVGLEGHRLLAVAVPVKRFSPIRFITCPGGATSLGYAHSPHHSPRDRGVLSRILGHGGVAPCSA